MKKTPTISLIILLILATFCQITYADNSLIESIIESKKSIVGIKAAKVEYRASDQASAAIDAKTGKLIIARNIKTATLEKNGAGVIIDPSGIIVTNVHTIRNTNLIYVKMSNNDTYKAKILKIMPVEDIALIQIEPTKPIQAISFANSDQVTLGQEIINIANSQFLNNTISGGRISRLGTKYLKANPSITSIELLGLNINLYKGDSGGPVLDKKGRLIGMIVAKNTKKQKETYAIPSNKILRLYQEYKNN